MVKYLLLIPFALLGCGQPEGTDISISSDIDSAVQTDNQQDDTENEVADPIIVEGE